MPRRSKFFGSANENANVATTPCRWSWILSGSVLLVTLHPIAAPDFWWHLARGRAVWEGHTAPSQALLLFEPASDADWLSGLPWYLSFSTFGPAFLSAGMAVAAVIAANLMMRGFAPSLNHHFRILLILLGFIAARLSWSPTPAFVDICGVISIWTLAGSLRNEFRRGTIVQLMLCEALWASFGTIPLLGLIVTLVRLNEPKPQASASIGLSTKVVTLVLLALAGSATPRGYLTLWDSFRVMFPWTCTDLGTLDAAGMLPRFGWPLTVELAAFLILGVIHLGLLTRNLWTGQNTNWRDAAAIVVATLIAISSVGNLGAAAFLLLLGTIDLAQRLPVPVSRESEQPATAIFWPRIVSTIAFAGTAAWVGCGFCPGSEFRMGWGLTPLLETSLIEEAFTELKLEGSGYCSGVREAGLLAWFRPGPIRPSDSPPRALLSGRLKDHVRIAWDLAHGWRDQHRRSDGTWGGWLTPLRERKTRLLLISADQYAVIRALETSHWKPFSIDAGSIPYGFAGDPALTGRIKKGKWLLDLVDLGEWTFPLPPASGGGSHFDLYGWYGGRHDRRNDLRQARTLVAMKRYYAALKVLKHGRDLGDPMFRREFCEIQLQMAYREFLANGQATSWHLMAYLESGGDPKIANDLNPLGDYLYYSLPDEFPAAIAAYVQNDLELARKTLTRKSPQSVFGIFQIFLEQGNPSEATRWTRYLNVKFPNTIETEAVFNVIPPVEQ